MEPAPRVWRFNQRDQCEHPGRGPGYPFDALPERSRVIDREFVELGHDFVVLNLFFEKEINFIVGFSERFYNFVVCLLLV